MQNIARRNSLLTHTSAALRQLQHQLDAMDEFVKHYFQGPWENVGLKDAGRHWLDTVARYVGVVSDYTQQPELSACYVTCLPLHPWAPQHPAV